jgi:hypothetical protein
MNQLQKSLNDIADDSPPLSDRLQKGIGAHDDTQNACRILHVVKKAG